MAKTNWNNFWTDNKIQVDGTDTFQTISWDNFFNNETIKNLPLIEVKLKDAKLSYKIDKKEFERCNELKGGLGGINWVSRLQQYGPIKKK